MERSGCKKCLDAGVRCEETRIGRFGQFMGLKPVYRNVILDGKHWFTAGTSTKECPVVTGDKKPKQMVEEVGSYLEFRSRNQIF